MSAQNQAEVVAADLRRALVPLLALRPPESETSMGRTVGEALALPSAETVLRDALARETVAPLRAESVAWLRAFIRPEWLVGDVDERLYAVPLALDRQDAFIGAWTHRGRLFQTAVTGGRVHLLTRLPEERDGPASARALRFAHELLRLSEPLREDEWTFRAFGGLTLGVRRSPDISRWPDSLLILTDGSAVKYSILKYQEGASPPQRESAGRPEPVPWFPRRPAPE